MEQVSETISTNTRNFYNNYDGDNSDWQKSSRDYYGNNAGGNEYENTAGQMFEYATTTNKQSSSAYSFGADDNAHEFSTKYAKNFMENQGSTGASPSGYSNKLQDEYGAPSYTTSYQSRNEYREYKNGELTSGYNVNESDNDKYGYSKTIENLVSGEKKTETHGHIQNAITGLTNFSNTGLDLKESMVEDDPYNVNWDPEILADLQANVHRNWVLLINQILI